MILTNKNIEKQNTIEISQNEFINIIETTKLLDIEFSNKLSLENYISMLTK